MTPKELITANFKEILKRKIDYYGQTEAAYEFAAEEYARELLSTHTREVAEKAFEAAREMEIRNNDGNTWYQKYPTFEDYLNSLNPEGK